VRIDLRVGEGLAVADVVAGHRELGNSGQQGVWIRCHGSIEAHAG